MRDMNLTYAVFKEQYRKQSERKFSILSSKDSNILRNAVVTNPTFQWEYDIHISSKFNDVRGLCLYWEKLPENIRYEIYFLLLDKIKKFDFKKQVELESLLDPETRIIFLFLSKKYSSYEIFGNLLHLGLEAIRKIKYKKKCKKVKKPQRKRGYHDKGILRCFAIWNHKWKPSSDFSLTELQNQIERHHFLHNKNKLRVKNYLLRNKHFTSE